MTVSELLDTLQAIEADGNGDARLYAYLDADGVKVSAVRDITPSTHSGSERPQGMPGAQVQAEGKHPAPALVGVILKAPIEIRAGAQVVTP